MNEEDFNITKKFKLRKKDAVFYAHGVGLDIDKYCINDEEKRKKLRKELGFSEDDVLILTVAEININKNHKQIIDTIKILKNYSNIYYLIVGTGEEEEKLKNHVLLNNLGNRIKFLGYRRDISKILNAIDIFALTSLREGLPRAIMEAMAAGKPIIATNVRGNRGLVVDGVNGYLVPVNDVEATAKAITKLAENKILRTKMEEDGGKIIQDYAIEKVLSEMDEIYSLYL
ncbi:glycosyltransferase [Caldanaerobacter subterraneus]|uniref:Glycosyl transferase family 1 n=1 Tax=Caldanaerobacter subterraneus TaxID=911092 RepID=A0A4R2JSL5_9THEO|nr:glycosyltransferase [Caldanaerobacter subterraneus]TCO60248.1 glycosyl transferase family 1 [Caldanaerobacter subterraneus]